MYTDLCRVVFCKPPQDPSEFPKRIWAPALWHRFQRVHHVIDPGVVHRTALARLHCLEPDIHLAVSCIGSAHGSKSGAPKDCMDDTSKIGEKNRIRLNKIWGSKSCTVNSSILLSVPTAPCPKASRSMLEISPPAHQSGASGAQSPGLSRQARRMLQVGPHQNKKQWQGGEGTKMMEKPCKDPGFVCTAWFDILVPR